MVEMAFRAYDPCLGCATHALPGAMPLVIQVRGPRGAPLAVLRRDADGAIRRE
jgi:F420-non-reducing hydrogenase large subunit